MPIDTGEISFRDNVYIRYAALSDKGCVRSHNEDNYGIFVENSLFSLADGVGGLDAGEIASEELILSISVFLQKYNLKQRSLGWKFFSLFRQARSDKINMRQLIETANLDIYKHAQALQKRMATTAVILQAEGEELTVAHVGDSRAYLLRNQIIGQITNDHTLSMELMLAGTPVGIDKLSVPNHAITKAVGGQADVSPDETRLKWIENDIFLLCSDGLTDMVDDESIRQIVLTHSPSMQKICQKLVNAAKTAGGRDNITVIVGFIG